MTSLSRLSKQDMALGDTLRLPADDTFQREVMNSVEVIARQRLLEADEDARALYAQAQKEVDRRLAEAKAQAEKLLQEAHASVESIRAATQEEGFKTGFEEGYQDGMRQASVEMVNSLESAQGVLDAAHWAEQRVLEHFKPDALAIMSHILKKILGTDWTALAGTPVDRMIVLLEQAIDTLALSGQVQVVVNPQVLQDLREASEQTQQAFQQLTRLDFIADPLLPKDKIYVLNRETYFDISANQQVDSFITAIQETLQLPDAETDF